MTVMSEPDTRGVDALSGHVDDNLLPPLIFDELLAEMAMQLADAPWPDELPVFDAAPWEALPTVEDMEPLWLTSAPIDMIIARLGNKAHGDGPDLMEFMSRQWQLAGMELDPKRSREAADAETGTDDGGAVGGASGVVSAAALGGGVDFSGQPENGDKVDEGGETAGNPHAGRPSKVSGKRRSRKAAAG